MNTQKFETIAVQYQTKSKTKDEALTQFRLSCKICVAKKLEIHCDKCSVRVANSMTVAALSDM
jgi:hypothetical protein